MLRQVTDLFVHAAPSYSDDQVAVFGIIIDNLIEKVDRKALVELSSRLASIENAPAEAVKRLARHDDVAIAGLLLEKSSQLSEHDLVEIAEEKGQGHLLAIAGRSSIDATVTTILVSRGTPEVVQKSIANEHAQFSAQGFVKAIGQAKNHKRLAEMIAARKDLPDELQPFLQLALA